MKKYIPTIGLEIHAELRTQTKMFCDSKNDTEEKRPNVNVCPVCMGYPGTLPVINKEAVKHVLKLGVATHGTLADYTEFDRKNYFYPDIPKGYQISQYKHPLVTGGTIAGIAVTRIHLEEDTARSTHDKSDDSLLDFNRAGVPLMELVTEPVIHDAETAVRFAKELQLLLWSLEASHANMEKGEMRVEANISVSNDETLGTKVEVKNLNSFKAVEKAILFEVERHIELLEKGERVIQETRGWNEKKEETFSQRAKEDSHDYRYFPDPDLPKLKISEVPGYNQDVLLQSLPELPEARRQRYIQDYALKPDEVEILVRDREWGSFFERATKDATPETIRLISNYLLSDLTSLLTAKGGSISTLLFSPEAFRELMEMVATGELSSRGAKDTLAILVSEGGSPRDVAKKKGLFQKSDEGELTLIVEKIISSNENVVKEYKNGNSASLQFLIGQAMKETKGSANPQLLKKIFETKLK